MSLRFGIIGCGVIGPTHADAIKGVDGAELTAVMDVLPEKAKALGERYGAKPFNSLAPFFKHVDAVCVAVPSGLHAQVGIKAAKAGKHVVCEKPIDVNLGNAQKLVGACREAGVTLTVISQHRFADDIRKVREAAQSGGMGELLIGEAHTPWYRTQAYYDSAAWRGTWKLDGGGCLMNQGVHYVDMIQWIMGGVKTVQAVARTATHKIEVEDIAYALIEYKNGAVGLIHGSTSSYPGFAERLVVHGRFGSAILEGDRLKAWHVDPDAPTDPSPYGRGVQKQPTPNLSIMDKEEAGATGAADPTAIWGEQHRLQIEDFVQAVKDKRDPFITGEMAMEPLKVILAIYRSAKLGGRRVEV